MAKRMLIAVDEEESRVAIIDKRRLENLEIESNGGEGRRGNVYKGVVHKVEQSLQAAFIDFGEEKQGFLPLSEIHRRLWPKSVTDKRPDIGLLLREGQELMVQVVKDEIGTKGATLTTYASLPGRYLVLMPESDKHGISRRLSDTERRRLKETVDSIGVPEGFGVIIRTAGQQQRPLELKKDLLYLTKLYESIEQKFGERRKSGLIYRDRRHAVRFIRDYFSDDVEEVWCDNRGVLKEISEFMGVLMPGMQARLRLFEGPAPLFLKFGVEDQIESVFARTVQLPAGGSIVIDTTEALVAIDVNSGKVKGQDIEETALTTNLEAAEELARQVRIRDLGGLLVVDFIDMRERKNNRKVEQLLRSSFQDDKAKIKFGKISNFGLMELSRQRLRKSLTRSVTRRCDACDGTGRVRAPASAALSLLRRIEEACLRGNVKYIRATTPVPMANVLLNRRRREMMEIEAKMGVIVEVVAHRELPANLVALDIVLMRGGRQPPQRIYQLLDLIRNEVIRKDKSPLPKPEEGLEALEMDHQAIYRAIAERDALLQAQEEAEQDFEYTPREPDMEAIDAETEEAPKPKRKRKRRDRRDRREDSDVESASSDSDDEQSDTEPAPPAPAPVVEAPVPDEGQNGFWAFLKRKFFSRGEKRSVTPPPAAPETLARVADLEPVTDEEVAKREGQRESQRDRGERGDDAGRGRRRRARRDDGDDDGASDRGRSDRNRDDDDGADRPSRGRGRGRRRRDRSGRDGERAERSESVESDESNDDDREPRRRSRRRRSRRGRGEGERRSDGGAEESQGSGGERAAADGSSDTDAGEPAASGRRRARSGRRPGSAQSSGQPEGAKPAPSQDGPKADAVRSAPKPEGGAGSKAASPAPATAAAGGETKAAPRPAAPSKPATAAAPAPSRKPAASGAAAAPASPPAPKRAAASAATAPAPVKASAPAAAPKPSPPAAAPKPTPKPVTPPAAKTPAPASPAASRARPAAAKKSPPPPPPPVPPAKAPPRKPASTTPGRPSVVGAVKKEAAAPAKAAPAAPKAKPPTSKPPTPKPPTGGVGTPPPSE